MVNEINKLMAEKRWIYWIPIDSYVDDKGFVPSIVF